MQTINAGFSRAAFRPPSRARRAHSSSSRAVWCNVVAPSAIPVAEAPPSDKQAVLYTTFKAHDAAVTALAVLKDEPGYKQIVTASLDKSLAVWTLEGGDLDGPQLQCISRLEVAGGPVFSLKRGAGTKVTDVNVKPREPVLFCGTAAKEITALRPDTLTFDQQTRMNGHTGWVRSLASSGKYLFSCGCNHLHQWDQAYAVPKEVRSMSLFTGDILALAATDKAVFTAGADGSLRRWALGKLGELSEAEVRDKAHDGRITALAVAGSLLFSAGYDGDIKAWDVSNLQLVMEVKGAHAGERVRSLVMGPMPPSSKAVTPASSTSSSPSGSPAPSPQPAATASMGEVCIEAQQPAVADVCFEAQQHQQHQQQPEQQLEQQLEHQQQPEQQTGEVPQAATAVASSIDPASAQTSEYDPTLCDDTPTPEAAAAADPGLSEYEPVPDPPAATAADPGLSEYEPVPDPPAGAAAVPAPPQSEQASATLEAATPPPSAEVGGPADASAAETAAPAPTPAAASPPATGASSPSGSRAPSPSSAVVLFSAGDDGMVRRWDARLLAPVGAPLSVHHGAVKALAVGDKEVMVSGDASGEVAVWLL